MRTPVRHVSKKGVEKWYIRFRKDGHQTTHTFGTYEGAEAFAKLLDNLGPERAIAVLEKRKAAPEGTYTVASWCTHHIDTRSGIQDDTTARYRSIVDSDLGDLGPMPLDAVSHEDVAAWVNAMQKAGASGKTIRNKHGFLSAAMRHALRNGAIHADPTEGTRLPRSESKPMVFLTHEEYLRFLGCFTPHWQPLVTTLFSTGLRWSEATALRVGDVDLNLGTISVTRAWKRDRTVGPPKSKRSRRTIAIPPELVEVLRPLIEDRPGHAWVFRNQHGDPVRHQSFSDNVWTPAVRLANGEPPQGPNAKRVSKRRQDALGRPIKPLDPALGKRPRIHDARHSCASWLLAAGLPLNVVQDHLGHESITTTTQVYGHILPSARQYVRAAISHALSPAHPQIEA